MKIERKVLVPTRCLELWKNTKVKEIDRNLVLLVVSELVRRIIEEENRREKTVEWITMNQLMWMKRTSIWKRRFRRILEILEEENVIVSPKGYRQGSSRKYKLMTNFRSFSSCTVIVKKRSTGKENFSNLNHQWIYDSLVRTRLPLGKGKIDQYVRLTSEDLDVNDIRLSFSRMYDKLRLFYLHRGVQKHERVFHQVTNLPKRYRHELTIDGRKTVELDISSSHFVLLLGLCKSSDIPIHQPIEPWLKQGTFYEEINERVWNGARDREHVKRLCQKFLSSKPRSRLGKSFDDLRESHPKVEEWYKELRQYFKETEPELSDFINQHNKITRSVSDGLVFQSIGGLLYTLLMKEVEVVIEGIVDWCRDHGIPVISIHDGVVIKKTDFRKFKLKTEFQRIISESVGVVPKLKEL